MRLRCTSDYYYTVPRGVKKKRPDEARSQKIQKTENRCNAEKLMIPLGIFGRAEIATSFHRDVSRHFRAVGH